MAKPKYTTYTGVKAEEIPARLAEKFVPEAYKGVPGGADLTDINTGFMIERVTQVFGPKGLGWNLLYSPNDLVTGGESGRTVTRLNAQFLYVLWDDQGQRLDCVFPVSGVNQNDFKYADEGARTSAVGAAIKWLCFQNDVYKGIFDHHDAEKEKRQNGNTNGAVSQPPATPPANGNGNGSAQSDDNTIATAGSKGMVMYAELCVKAEALKIQPAPVTPGKTTVSQLRKMYGELQEKINAAQPASTAA